MGAKNRSGIREVGISIMSKSGISFFFNGVEMWESKGKVVSFRNSFFCDCIKRKFKGSHR